MSEQLVGRTLYKIQIAQDRKALLFYVDGGEIKARADGDCCYDSWIESVEILAKLPAKILSVDDISLNVDADTRGGELSFYGLGIKTDSGDITIDYRNESNGYYGGSLSWEDEYFYGGVWGQNVSGEKWVDVE